MKSTQHITDLLASYQSQQPHDGDTHTASSVCLRLFFLSAYLLVGLDVFLFACDRVFVSLCQSVCLGCKLIGPVCLTVSVI